jgi:hypothetical protein
MLAPPALFIKDQITGNGHLLPSSMKYPNFIFHLYFAAHDLHSLLFKASNYLVLFTSSELVLNMKAVIYAFVFDHLCMV